MFLSHLDNGNFITFIESIELGKPIQWGDACTFLFSPDIQSNFQKQNYEVKEHKHLCYIINIHTSLILSCFLSLEYHPQSNTLRHTFLPPFLLRSPPLFLTLNPSLERDYKYNIKKTDMNKVSIFNHSWVASNILWQSMSSKLIIVSPKKTLISHHRIYE